VSTEHTLIEVALTHPSVCVVSLLRVVLISRMNFEDFHYTYADLGMWSIVESKVGIINACMPVMQPVLRLIANAAACRRLLPPSWMKRSSYHSTTLVDHKLNGREDTMNRKYPLDTIHLFGEDDNSVNTRSFIDIERHRSSVTIE
jgi:hypothetical protein